VAFPANSADICRKHQFSLSLEPVYSGLHTGALISVLTVRSVTDSSIPLVLALLISAASVGFLQLCPTLRLTGTRCSNDFNNRLHEFMKNKGMAFDSFCAWDGETLVLNILGQPSAKQDAIGKAKGKQLKISVTAAPVAGRATDHMVRFLAKEFGVTPKDIEVVFGRFNVNKQLRIKSPKNLPAVINKHLSQ